MHVLCGLRRDEALQRLPELRRRFCTTPDPPDAGMAAGCVHDQAGTVGQAGASEGKPGGCRGAFREDQGRGAGETIGSLHAVIARSPCDEAIQKSLRGKILDCFAALAMTENVDRASRRFSNYPAAKIVPST